MAHRPIKTAALVGLALPLTALAQFEPTTREALHGCAVLESVPRRLDCIDSVLAGVEREAAQAGAGSRTPSAAAPAAESNAAAARAAESNAAAARAAESRAAATRAAEPNAAATPRSPAQPAAPAREPEVATERVEAPADGMVTIVRVDTRIPGRTVFITESGRRFEQTSGGSRLLLPDVPFEAELTEGTIGGQFLSPVELGRAVRVTQRD